MEQSFRLWGVADEQEEVILLPDLRVQPIVVEIFMGAATHETA